MAYVTRFANTTQNTDIITLDSGITNYVYVAPKVALVATETASVITGNGNSGGTLRMVNEGSLIGGDLNGTVKLNDDGNMHVSNTAGATIASFSPENGIALRSQGGRFSMDNAGAILGAIGLNLVNTTATAIDNSGKISGTGVGVLGAAINFQGTGASAGAAVDIFNSGEINGSNDLSDARAIIFLTSSTYDTKITNTGTLHGLTRLGASGDRLINMGQWSGDIEGNGGNDILQNSGTIAGTVLLGNDDDLYRGIGTGVVIGEVLGAAGSDTLIGGEVGDSLDGGANDDLLAGHGGDDTMLGGSGNDTLLGGDGNDEMEGGNGDDVMNGNAGSDMLSGEVGNDVLVGQDGNDLLDGGDDDDTLDGGAGDDILEGGQGNDILRGRAGEDELAGGEGRDFLTGGEGADTFVFRALAETAVGANRDQILDFEQGVDLITVAGLSPGVFEFRGTAPFAPSGNPELRLVETAAGSTIVQLDANGDGTADAEIRVANVTGLTAEDFTL